MAHANSNKLGCWFNLKPNIMIQKTNFNKIITMCPLGIGSCRTLTCVCTILLALYRV